MADSQPAIVTTARPLRSELRGEIGNRFVILKCLGLGGMGEVYCARDTLLKFMQAAMPIIEDALEGRSSSGG